jgi:hypothetical protein
MATIRGSNWPDAQKLTPAGTVKSTLASFPTFFLHRCVIKCGTTNTWGHWGWAIRSSQNNSSAVSITAGGTSHSLAASRFLSLNMVCTAIHPSGFHSLPCNVEYMQDEAPISLSLVEPEYDVVQFLTWRVPFVISSFECSVARHDKHLMLEQHRLPRQPLDMIGEVFSLPYI